MLEKMPGHAVRVLMVWLAVLPTDSAPPNERVLARARDPRVTQYWDAQGTLAKIWQPVLRQETTPIAGHSELVLGDLIWDMAAVFAPGARWDTQLPPTRFKGAPVVQTITELAQALG